MSEQRRVGPRLNKRFSQIVMGVAAALVAAWWLGMGTFSILAVPLGLVYWAYVVSTVWLVQWAVLHVRKQGVPEIPFLSARFAPKKILLALCGFVALITLAREGAFAPDFVLSINHYETTMSTQTQIDTHSNSTSIGGAVVHLAGRRTTCMIDCSQSGSPTCQSATSQFACDDEVGTDDGAFVNVRISVDDEPSCYMPLYKSGETSFSADVTISAQTPGVIDVRQAVVAGSANYNLSVNGTVRLEMTGVGSCYQFRQLVGAEMGRQVTNAIDEVLRSN